MHHGPTRALLSPSTPRKRTFSDTPAARPNPRPPSCESIPPRVPISEQHPTQRPLRALPRPSTASLTPRFTTGRSTRPTACTKSPTNGTLIGTIKGPVWSGSARLATVTTNTLQASILMQQPETCTSLPLTAAVLEPTGSGRSIRPLRRSCPTSGC